MAGWVDVGRVQVKGVRNEVLPGDRGRAREKEKLRDDLGEFEVDTGFLDSS